MFCCKGDWFLFLMGIGVEGVLLEKRVVGVGSEKSEGEEADCWSFGLLVVSAVVIWWSFW